MVSQRRVLYSDNRQVVFMTDAQMPDGAIAEDYLCCDFGPSVTVLSVYIDSHGCTKVVMQHNYTVATKTIFVTTQAGGIERLLVGDSFKLLETPEEAARREVKEEAGVDVLELIPLGITNHYASKLVAPEHLFLAIVGEPTSDLLGDKSEGTKPFIIDWEDLKDMIFQSPYEFMPVTIAIIVRAASLLN